ncbi:MAG TPA: hypothetical protein VJV78_40065 [Polyangiales bacterium]|nr:hypothetical protein [Polyangiales bacterium]
MEKRRVCDGVLLVCLTFAYLSAPARADEPVLHVRIAPDACPTPSLLQERLAPLVDAEIDASEPASSEPGAVVTDHGDHFTVEVGAQRREFSDPARDCQERARISAVFIALNLHPQTAEPAAPVANEQEAKAEPARASIGMQLAAAAAYATDAEHIAPGAAIGLWIELGAWRFAFDAGALLGVPIALESDPTLDVGSAQLVRMPLSWSATYFLELGPFAFGPALGLALDVLYLQGSEPVEPHTGVRANLGGLASVDIRLRASSHISVLLRTGLSLFPRAYALGVAPLGQVGETPTLWLGANLAIAWRFAG